MRFTLRLLAMALWLFALLILHGATRLLRRPSPWPRRFLGGVARIAGARVSIRGRPVAGRALFLANHQSWLDIMVMAGATGCAFVSKAEVGRWPLLGWLAGLNDTIYVERENRAGVRAQADTLHAALAGGARVALFPEGTIAEGANGSGRPLLPFRASLLAAAAPPPPGLAVQPVAIRYRTADDNLAWVDEPALRNVMRVLARAGRFDVELRFLDPLPPCADRKALARSARDAVLAALGASDCARSSL